MRKKIAPGIYYILGALAVLSGLFGGPFAGQFTVIPAAVAAGFEDPAVRKEALNTVLQKTVPGGPCGSLIMKQEDFLAHCREDMLPLKRKYCKGTYDQIMAEMTCEYRPVMGRSQTRKEKCVALRDGYAELCGANETSEYARDCRITNKKIQSDCPG